MSVKMIFGLPGSGKSTVLASIARDFIKRGKKVYSNYYIEGAYTLNVDRLGIDDYSDCVLLLDEISLVCDSRDWKKFSPELRYFFSNHRHYNCEVWVCSQSYEDCDKRIRNITDELYYCESSSFGFSRLRRVEKTLLVENGHVSEYYTARGLGRFIYRPRYYKYFDSYVRLPLPPNTEKLYTTCKNK